MSGLLIKAWNVAIDGYGAHVLYAGSRGKALAAAWRCDVFEGYSFGQFMKMATCRRAAAPQGFGRPVMVDGKPAFFVESNRQYVRFAWPDSDVILSSHPYDVLPEDARPDSYRGHRP